MREPGPATANPGAVATAPSPSEREGLPAGCEAVWTAPAACSPLLKTAGPREAGSGAPGTSMHLFGTTFSLACAEEVIANAAAQPPSRTRLVVTANVDHIVILSENAAFRKAYAAAAVRTLDGAPLVWLARLSGARGARRITGHDLLAAALAAPSPARRVFLVCSSEAVGARVAAQFVRSGLSEDAVQAISPPFGFERDEVYSTRLAAAVRAHGTTLLVMGVGAPKSEIWIDRYAFELGAPVVLAVGEAIDVAAGLVPRAPVLMQVLCLEWFFRFLNAPRRLFPRYFLRSWRFARILLARRRAALDPAVARSEIEEAWMLRPELKPEWSAARRRAGIR